MQGNVENVLEASGHLIVSLHAGDETLCRYVKKLNYLKEQLMQWPSLGCTFRGYMALSRATPVDSGLGRSGPPVTAGWCTHFRVSKQ